MNATERYNRIFGSIESLADDIPWTTGLSNMVEHLLWDTKSILGISKTRFWQTILSMTEQDGFPTHDSKSKHKFVKTRLDDLLKASDVSSRYSPPRHGYCSPSEALRRAKYFSEDYLNKEFDIFLNLCSDRYLDFLYSRFIPLQGGGHWSTHGNSGLFATSTGISEMQMDNLAYNKDENALVANELKLGGKKNRDQLLKYCFMQRKLETMGFVSEKNTFALLFIGDKEEEFELSSEVAREVQYCQNTGRHHLLEDALVEQANVMTVERLTWSALIDLNNSYLDSLEARNQVETKLLKGFNSSLQEKAFLQDHS